MVTKAVLQPGPEHPITISTYPDRVVVMVAGRVVADSRRALTLAEANLPPVLYIPRADADMTLLEPTAHHTYCPYKGDCSHFSIPVGGDKAVNAVWSYEMPYPAVAAIAGYLAFYPSRVDAIELLPVG
jgi:uncharacterized protein (DUF427 family)